MFRLVNFQAGRTRLPRPTLPGHLPPKSSLRLSAFKRSEAKTDAAAADEAGWSLRACLRRHHQSLLFLTWLVLGSVFYSLHAGEDFGSEIPRTAVDGFYEAVTVGYSVGLSPRDPNYMPNPWFSSAYILVGASLIAVILTSLGQRVEDGSSKRLFEDLKRRERYEAARRGGLFARTRAFCGYNASYLATIALWVGFLAFIVVWSIVATSHNDPLPGHRWGFAYAQYFAISLCSSAGSFSLPYESPLWAYGLAAVSMAVGVPLMALAISSIVLMCMQEAKYDKVKKAAWTPITTTELDNLRRIGLGNSEEVISKGDFVLLGMLRMGTEAGLIAYLCDAYDSVEDERGCVAVQTEGSSAPGGTSSYSAQARCYVGGNDGRGDVGGSSARFSGAPLADEDAAASRRPRMSSRELSAAVLSFASDGTGLSASMLSSASSMDRRSLATSKGSKDNWSVRAAKDEKSILDLGSLMRKTDVCAEGGGMETLSEMPEEVVEANNRSDSFQSNE